MKIAAERLMPAYQKLKRFVYYDNTNLSLRKSLAEFECDPSFKDRLLSVLEVVNSDDPLKNPMFNKWLSEISFRVVPKKLKPSGFCICDNSDGDEARNDGKFISNVTSAKVIDVEKVNYFFDGPIELHLIAVLWIISEGLVLDSQLGNECYGSRLEYGLHYPNDESTVLFRRYHELYAQWRDSGIRKAKQLLVDEKKSVCILGLDIQEYYYRIRLNYSEIAQAINQSASDRLDGPSNLLNCLKAICTNYREKIDPFLSITHELDPLDTGIPIGLCSSPLLANWYLRNFDKAVNSFVRPAFYGRYVDDILMVIADPEDPSNDEHPVATFMDRILVKAGLLNKCEKNRYEFIELPGLFLQQGKCILQYFDAGHSIAGLEKFQKKLEENVSNFMLLPVDEAENSLEDVAYELLYEGSVNKFRSVKGTSENRYELAKHLSRQTMLHLLTDDPPNTKISLGLRKFFKGKNAIEFHDLWERVFTFFLISDDLKGAKAFAKHVHAEIKRIKYKDKPIEKSLIGDLETHLLLSLCMADALGNTDWLLVHDNDRAPIVKWIRDANLIRHHFVRMPLLNYTTYSGPLNTRMVKDMADADPHKLAFSPRYVNFDECLLLSKSGDVNLNNQSAFEWACGLYEKINGRNAQNIVWDSIQVNRKESDV